MRVVIAEDDALLREGLALLLKTSGIEVVAADEFAGSGLAGIRRRAEAFDGTLSLTSPPGGPTVLRVELPCGS